MEWIGFVALALVLCYSSLPENVKRLERKIKQLERQQKGETPMSKLIMELIGHKCRLYTEPEEALSLSGKTSIECQILDADEEWIKISHMDKKTGEKISFLRIDTLKSAELLEPAPKEI